jgi:cation diffusion facilitator CzcD-associated flavoprotein CzcO
MHPEHEAIIVGAGLGGLQAAIELKRMGIENILVLEKADGVGGTWRVNSYPGLAVDIPSFVYSYSFELNAEDWSEFYSPGPDIKAYAERCADKYGITPHIRFGRKVAEARFVDDESYWRVRLTDGEELTTRYLFNACGYLSDPRFPDIPGFAEFTGKIMRPEDWDHDYDLDSKRVAVIGTGASAIQLAPAIADRLQHLDVYQRTAIWLMPKPNITFSEQTQRRMQLLRIPRIARTLMWFPFDLFLRVTFVDYQNFGFITRAIERALARRVRRTVDDPETAEALIPQYSFFCKRPSLSNTFYPMFNKAHVDLVTDPISHVTQTGIVTKDGTHREVDAIVCATGYHVFDRSSSPMFKIVGENGQDLGEWWHANRYLSYRGTAVPGFPNLFLMCGPYALGGHAYPDVIGSQLSLVRRVLRAAMKKRANYVDVKPEAFEHERTIIDRTRGRTVLHAGNCGPSNTYYRDRNGDFGAAPRAASSTTAHWIKCRLISANNYRYECRAPAKRASAAR